MPQAVPIQDICDNIRNQNTRRTRIGGTRYISEADARDRYIGVIMTICVLALVGVSSAAVYAWDRVNTATAKDGCIISKSDVDQYAQHTLKPVPEKRK